MTDLTAIPGWDPVVQHETTTRVLGGPGGPMNQQAQALLNRTEELRNMVEGLDPAAQDGFAEGVDDRVVELLTAGANVALSYNDTLGRLTISSTAEGGVGGSDSPAMRTVQQVLHRANFTMGNNKFTAGESTSGGVVTPEASVPAGFTTVYPASVTERPWRWYGGTPVLDGFGVRLNTSTWQVGERIASGSPACQVAMYGDELLMELEAGFIYKFLVKEQGVDSYLPESDVTLATGTGAQLYRLAFPTVAQRIITIETSTTTNPAGGIDQMPGRIGALRVKASNSVLYAAPYAGPRMLFVSDSGMQGVNGWPGASNACVIAECLGIKDHILSCNHSTGVLITDESALKWTERENDWLDYAPDVLVFRLSWAEPGRVTTAAAHDAVMGVISRARAGLPNAFIIVQGYDSGPAVDYPNNTEAQEINVAVSASVVALNDPFIKYVQPFDSLAESIFTDTPGTRDTLLAGHYSATGDLVLGFLLAERYLALFNEAFYGEDSVPTPPEDAFITPTSGVQNLVIGVPVDVVLGTVSNGVPSGITSGGDAPVGCTLSIVGQTLKLIGTPTELDADISTVVNIATNNGAVAYSLSGAVNAAPVASIAPTSGVFNLTEGIAVNSLLGTISNGTPTGSPGGVPPPGCTFVFSGQQIRITGTPTTIDPDIATTVTATTDNGSVNFAFSGSVAAAGGGDDPFLAQKEIVLNGGGITNDMPGGAAINVGTGTPASVDGYVQLQTGDSLVLPNNSAMGLGTEYSGSLTIRLRVKVPALGGDSKTVFSNLSGNTGEFEVNISSAGVIQAFDMASAWVFATTETYAEGDFVEVELVYDEVTDTVYFYVGADLVDSFAAPPTLNTNTEIHLGRRPNFGDNWLGSDMKFEFTAAARNTGATRTVPTWPVQVA